MTAIEPAGPGAARDPDRPSRLLRAEHDALLPILHRTPDPGFDRPAACPGWSVRDVLAHCAAALSRVTAGNLHAFTPALNEADVAGRRAWPLAEILSELAAGYLEAGKAITRAGGKLDVLALGEWLHGVRVTSHACDVSDEAQVLRFRDELLEQHASDHVDLVFSNAGVFGGASFVKGSRQEWERTFAINWQGVYFCARTFAGRREHRHRRDLPPRPRPARVGAAERRRTAGSDPRRRAGHTPRDGPADRGLLRQ